MSERSDARREFEEIWDTRSLEARTMTLGATQTIRPTTAELAADRRSVLPHLVSTQRQHAQLEVLGEIGRGGMGVVRRARQIALDREVAIKQVSDNRRDARHAQELLLEGLLVGSLEHPNIVPIYMLGQDADGYPTLVMKRIEGTVWTDVLQSGAVPDGVADPLEYHLDVFMQVCNAVHFAHSRRVLHRDIKPDNVMVGRFGEVYVLDWGIAVSLDPTEERFPVAAESREVVGTPSYMAPEMVHGDGTLLTERTDVYLLGALLHEIVTGDPPHGGRSLFDVMFSAYRSEPADYGDLPLGLQRICHRAMAADPAERFTSADELRQAVATFLRHRESSAISDDADRAAEQLRGAIAAGAPSETIDAAFQAARYGYEAALAAWPENPRARQGRDEVLGEMLEHEIEEGHHHAARLLLVLLDSPPDDAESRIVALEREAARLASAARELEKERFERDLTLHAVARARGLFGTSVIWTLVTVAAWHYGWFASHWALLAFVVVSTAIGGAFVLYRRDQLLANRVSRQFVTTYITATISTVAVHVVIGLSGADPRLAPVFDLVVFGASALLIGSLLDRWTVIAALLYFVAAGFGAVYLDASVWILLGTFTASQVALAIGDLLFVHVGPQLGRGKRG